MKKQKILSVVLFGSLLFCAVTLSSCAASKAIKAAPSVDAVDGLADKIRWIRYHGKSGDEFVLELENDYRFNRGMVFMNTLSNKGKENMTITLRGVGGERTIIPEKNAALFTVDNGVTLVLDSGITLRGNSQGGGKSLINVTSGGTFIMNEGAAVLGNTNNSDAGGGVSVGLGGTFHMKGGLISGNASVPTPSMIQACVTGKALGNAMANRLHGEMSKGLTSATKRVAGETVAQAVGDDLERQRAEANAKFDPMAECLAEYRGGGVYLSVSSRLDPQGLNRRFASATFVKTGGTITGFADSPGNGNVVRDINGQADDRKGHAIYIGSKLDDSTKVTIIDDFENRGGIESVGGIAINRTIGPEVHMELRDGRLSTKIVPIAPVAPQEPSAPAPVAVAPVEEPQPEEEPEPEQVAEAQPEEAVVEEVVMTVEIKPFEEHTEDTVQTAKPDSSVSPSETIMVVEGSPSADTASQVPPPRVTVYIVGGKDDEANIALTADLLEAFSVAAAMPRHNVFYTEVEKELEKHGGVIDERAICMAGKQAGIPFVCVVGMTPVFGAYQINARVINVERVTVDAMAIVESSLESSDVIKETSATIVERLRNRNR